MLTLFDETKNPLFHLICQVINEIHLGRKYKRKDILQRILSMPTFQYNEAPEIEREKEIIDLLFDFSADGFAKLYFDRPISNLISITEISWLKTMIQDEEFSFLLPDDLRKKLLNQLKNIKPLYNADTWQKLKFKSNGKIFSKNLELIVNALRAAKILKIDEEKIIACRLEYDLFTDKYFIINWNEEKNSAEKISVEKLRDIYLTDENIPNDIEEKLQNFYQENILEITLRLKDTRNAVERCFALFGSYDKNARIQEDGSYFLAIKYYKFDEEEVLNRILSLGAAVTVISPENIRNQIIKKLLSIQSLYQDEEG